MSSGVTLDDKAFLAGLDREVKSIEHRSQLVVQAVGKEIASVMRSNAPVASGRLKDSIKSTPGRDVRGVYAELSVDPFYASFAEWGRSTRAAHPFFRPGLQRAAAAVRLLARSLV